MEERESVVVSGCEGGGGGGGGAGEAKEYSVSSAAPLSPTRSLPPALSSGVVGAMGITVPPTEGAGLAMGMLGSGGSSGGEGDLFARKKRGRPRKYGPDGMALALSPTSGSASPFSPASSDGKRGRGRPPGSGKRQLLEALGDWFAHSAGGSFTPHVVTIATGEDVAAKIHSFSQKGPRAICILSANGVISNVTLRQPGSSGGTLTYEGRFEILSLSGSFTITETGGIRSRTGGISVSLAGPDGRVIGGGVTGLLLAASPIQVVVGSFMPNTFKEQKPKPSQQADFSAFPETSGLLTAARPISQSNPEDDCETSTSSLPGQSHAENSLCNPTPTSTLHAAGWQGLQSSEHKPSPDINICLHGEQHQGESYTIREETNGFFEVEDEVLRRCTQLRPSITGDERADVTKSDHKESNCLEEEVEEVMVLPKGHIVAPTEEEVSACPKLQ